MSLHNLQNSIPPVRGRTDADPAGALISVNECRSESEALAGMSQFGGVVGGLAANVGSRFHRFAIDQNIEREELRIAEISRLDLTAEKYETIFAPYAERIARELNLPVGIVSLVLDRTQYFAAMYGGSGWLRAARCTPIEWSFCAYPVRRGRIFVVQDASKHPHLCTNPLVTHNDVRCYAGAPLSTPAGVTVGALAVVGMTPRPFLPAELDRLHDAATELNMEIERLCSRSK